MESKHFINCIKRSSRAFEDLTQAQDDCKLRVEAEIDLLAKECFRPITPAEKTNIKKFAKALASEKTDSLKKETKSMAKMVVAFFPVEQAELTLGWGDDNA